MSACRIPCGSEPKPVNIHEETTELKKELHLDSARFGMEGVVAQLQANLTTRKPHDTSQTQRNSLSNKESVGPIWYVCLMKAYTSKKPG